MIGFNVLDASKVGDISALRGLENLSEKLTDRNGACCIHYAARGGSVTVLEFLIKERGFSVFSRSKTGASALHDAAAKGNTAIIKWILTNTDLKVDDQDGAGITGLHLAARYGHILTVEWLIDEAESDVSIRTAGGALPLHFAVVGADLNCVKILVQENPRHINMQMNNGTTAVYLACQEGHLEVLKYLIEHNGASKIKAYDGMSCLHAAAQMGHLDVVKWLVKEEKMNPNDRDFDGLTPLHYAASRGHPNVVSWLMTQGNARITLDNLGGSPLHNAAEHSENECIQALLDTGCDVSITDNDGLTAAELADNCQHQESASLIRGLIPPLAVKSFDTSVDESTLEQVEETEPLVVSPHLVFPPPPAYPPGDESLSPRSFNLVNNYNKNNNNSHYFIPSTTSATTNTSFLYNDEEESYHNNNYNESSDERFPSPPLPPPPPSFSPPLSSPSTEGSPISPPSPIRGISWVAEDYNQYQHHHHHHPYPNHKPDYRRFDSNDSVDSDPVVRIVHAEIHKTNDTFQESPDLLTNSSPYSLPDQESEQEANNRNNYSFYSSDSTEDTNPSLSSFPPPPPPLSSQETFSNHKTQTSVSPPLPSLNTGKANSNSSRIAQFKNLFESKMSTNNGTSSRIASFPTQPLRPKEDTAPQGASVISINGKRATIVKSANVSSNGDDQSRTSSSPSSPQPEVNSSEITINGQAHHSSIHPVSPSSAPPVNTSVSVNGTVPLCLPKSPPPVQHHAAAKQDLISDIQSAISGTSSLSLRSAKSRGDGVSMVYRSSKDRKENGNSTEKNNQVPVQSSVLTGDFDPKNFLDTVEKVDTSGRAIPEWRRNLLAKHAAEKALKDFEEKRKVDEYESRFKDMPAWKRALIEKREGIAREDK